MEELHQRRIEGNGVVNNVLLVAAALVNQFTRARVKAALMFCMFCNFVSVFMFAKVTFNYTINFIMSLYYILLSLSPSDIIYPK
jgi:hypothetical protein